MTGPSKTRGVGQVGMARALPTLVHLPPHTLLGPHSFQPHLEQTHVDEKPGEEGVGVEGG